MATLGANASLYSEQHRITYYECDRTGRATLTTLIDIAVLASEDQSDALGLTTEMVQSHGVGWVVTQYAIDITRMPRQDEVVTIAVRVVLIIHILLTVNFGFGTQMVNSWPILRVSGS